jgi:Universal stress protein UspA and related nucleotide-binding proteins
MSKVVVGFDASEQSDDGLVLGQALAKVYGAELHVAVVLPRTRIPFEVAIAGGEVSSQLEERLYESAARRLGTNGFVRASLEGGVGGRSAARALYEYAQDQDADLIVVGSSHRGKVGRILPGSVGESLLRGAPCAVAVAPRGFAGGDHDGFDRIGIAYDGSQEADLALKQAERLSRFVRTHLRLITVVPTQTPFSMQVALSGELLEDVRDEFRRVQEKGLSGLIEKTGTEAVLREGDPAAILAEEGTELDLLVLGSRSYGPIRGALLGAISAAVLRTAPCPVLITPRGLAVKSEPGEGQAGHELAVEQ